jgi:flagellar biosynthesis/type III secretory pathway protein FliH
MSKKATNDALRMDYTNKLVEALAALGEEVLRVGSNEIAIPVVDAEGEDNFVTFTVKVPTGSRDGDAYDGYSMAQDYSMKLEEKKAKAEKAAADKARKIARDEKMRKQKAEAKAAREGDGKGE